MKQQQPGIYLGYPFDQLFDRNCDLEYWKRSHTKRKQQERQFVPAIKLPYHESPGTGNIVITGAPGSGKSTLAVQWAIKCAFRNDNRSNAAYFSFEQTLDEVISKARPFGWHKWMRRASFFDSLDDLDSPDLASSSLQNLLLGRTRHSENLVKVKRRIGGARKDPHAIDSAEDHNNYTRRVLLFSLSPRPLTEGMTHEELFWRRYQQLDRLLSTADLMTNDILRNPGSELARVARADQSAAALLRRLTHTAYPSPNPVMLPVVVLDSLNMFGTRPLGREEVFRLFSLFRKYKRIGIFVIEATQETPFDSTMADVVVSLSHQKDRGYFVQHFEIEKSRYYSQVNGLHPYKPASLPPGEREAEHLIPRMPTEDSPKAPRKGILVYPSLHYVVLRTEQTEKEWRAREPLEEPNRFGIHALKTILPTLPRQSVITIEGPSGTYKTSFAMNFLAAGLFTGESALLVRLSDIPLLCQKNKFSNKLSPLRLSQELAEKGFRWRQWERWIYEESPQNGRWSNLAGRHKSNISVWRKPLSPNGFSKYSTPTEPTLFELDFKSGALLPEEFVEIIRDILNRRTKEAGQQIRRVVLDDIGQIGVSYPFLRQSITTGDTFLSAFVHIMRNAGVDLVMIASTTGLSQADEIVTRACSLADAVLSCSFCDVFGERHIIVRRKGMIASKTEGRQSIKSREPVPGVIRLIDGNRGTPYTFYLDQDYLSGLVGFESGHIYRPGLLIHLFEENDLIHAQYNKETLEMLQAGFAFGSTPSNRQEPDVTKSVDMVTFNAERSEAIHGAVALFHDQERPLDRTVLFTVDEFGATLDYSHSLREQWAPVPEAKELNWDTFLLSAEHRFGEQQKGGPYPGYFWPYYSNVLLLAFRRENPSRTPRPQLQSWIGVEDLAAQIFRKGQSQSHAPACSDDADGFPAIKRAFWVDLSAAETLACVLMDALHVANGCTGCEFLNAPARRDTLNAEERREIGALARLLGMTGTHCAHPAPTPDDAGVYVLWYSQLRELIERCPDLATRLDICALPGHGFRGDWFAGIIRGSVNPAFGQRIIKIMCGQEEDHKRYVRGVGLPARSSFYTPAFYAWPRSSHVTLADLKPIWTQAESRRKIRDYGRIRTDIFALARQLTSLCGPVPDTSSDEHKHLVDSINVGRLFAQIGLLRSLGGPTTTRKRHP